MPTAGGEVAMNEPARAAYLVHYAGSVQGVGFRLTACAIARDYPVTGWVKNLPDGRVRLLAEGEEADVVAFLDRVRAHWGDAIEDEERQRQEATGKYRGFQVVR